MPYKTPISLNDTAILLKPNGPMQAFRRRPARLQKTRIAYALGLLLLGPVTTFGLELGEASIKSGLGQSLLVEIPYRLAANETLTPMCVSLVPAADAARALPTYVRASRIAVSSTHIEILGDARVLEPLIGLNVEVRCATTPHLVRSYQLFVDPPAQLPAVRFAAGERAAAAPVAANRPNLTPGAASAPAAVDPASTEPASALRTAPSPRARGHAGGNLTQGQTYRVVRGDTLSGIAARVGDRTTIRDAADAIFAANPDAFRRGNRDLLEEGRSITIPLMTAAPATLPAASAPVPLPAASELEPPAPAPATAVDLPPAPAGAEQAPRPADVTDIVIPAAPESPAAAVTAAAPIAAPVQEAAPADIAPEATSAASTGRASTWLTILLAFGAGILVSVPLHLMRRRKQQDVVQGGAKIQETRPRQLVDAVAGIDVVEGQLSRSLAGRMNDAAAWRAAEAERVHNGRAAPTGLDDLASTIGPVDSVDLDVGAPTAAADEQVAATIEEDAATARMPGLDSAATLRQQPPESKAAVSQRTVDDEQMTMTIVELDMLRQDYEAEHTMTQEANKALRDALADLKATQAARAASAEAPTMELPQQPEADATESLQTEKLRAAR